MGECVKIKKNSRGEEVLDLYRRNEENQIERKRKKIQGLDSEYEREILLKITNNMYENYNLYNKDLISKKDLTYKFIASQYYHVDDESNLTKECFDKIFEIAYDFFYKVNGEKIEKLNLIRDKYKCNENDIICYIIGKFGYGKTTLIKKIMGFPDMYPFPLVDNGRTTIHKTVYRLILNNIESHKYKLKIILKDMDKLKEQLIVPQLNKFIDSYFQTMLQNGEEGNINKEEILRSFIENEKADIDEIFGDIEKINEESYEEIEEKIKNNFSNIYEYLLYNTQNIYDKIKSKYLNLNAMDKNKLVDEFNNLIGNENDVSKIYREILDVIINVCRETLNEDIKKLILKNTDYTEVSMLENNFGNIKLKRNEKGDIKEYNLELKLDELGNIYDYISYFVTNNKIAKENLLRLFVEEMYVEFPIRQELENIIDDKFDINSLIFVDTMGTSHTTGNEKKSKVASGIMNMDLEETDLVLIMDNAKESMDEDTKKILKNVYSRINKNRIIYVYSYYDYFLKNEFKNDYSRERELYKRQRNAVLSFNDIDSNIENLKNFANEIKDRTVFLKGLVKFVNKISENSIDTGTSRISFSRKNFNEEVKTNDVINSNRLNLYKSDNKDERDEFNGISCLEKLIKIIVSTYVDLKEYFESVKLKDIFIEYDMEGIVALYNQVREEYIQYESDIYKIDIPHQSQTKALTYKLSKGYTGFRSDKIVLDPVEDAFNLFLQNANNFINNYIYINDNIKLKDSIKQDIKEKFLKFIKELLIEKIVSIKRSEWKELYKDCGLGVKKRRSNNIYMKLEDIFYPLNMSLDVKRRNEIDSWINALHKKLEEILREYKKNEA